MAEQQEQTNQNLAVWDSFGPTLEENTKDIQGKSYSGKSVRPMAMVKAMTERFGPCGIGWGYELLGQQIDRFGDESIHVATVKLWFMHAGQRGEVTHVGQTKYCYKTKAGHVLVDEDAPKKSITDAIKKAMSMIGVCNDIYMGLWEDDAYVADRRLDAAQRRAEREQKRQANLRKQAARDRAATQPQATPQPGAAPQVAEGSGPVQAPNVTTEAEFEQVMQQMGSCPTDEELRSVCARMFRSLKANTVSLDQMKEFATVAIMRRADLVSESGFKQFVGMLQAYQREGAINTAQVNVARELARGRLGLAE